MTQTAVCNRHHSVQQQLCRWLLTTLDRIPSGELVMTQELVASMLGVRREGHHRGRRKHCSRAGFHPLPPRPHRGPQSSRARETLLRVLHGRQEGDRAPAVGCSVPTAGDGRALGSCRLDEHAGNDRRVDHDPADAGEVDRLVPLVDAVNEPGHRGDKVGRRRRPDRLAIAGKQRQRGSPLALG